MNLKPYFTQQYLFQINSAYISPQEKLFMFAGAILVLLAIVFKIASNLALNPVDKLIRQKFYRLFFSICISELLWYLCRYENAMFFGTHFVAWIIALIGIIWFLALILSIFRNYKKDKVVWDKEQLKLKYLTK